MLNIEVQNKKQYFQNKEANITEKNCRLKLTGLNDQTLLSQTKLLAQKERNISIQVIRHLSEIEFRKLHLKRGFSSLFDYTVKELGYSEGSAYRRIKAMKLCREMPETTVKLKTGELNLTTVSQLQTFFEKQNRKARKTQLDLSLKNTKQQDYQTGFETQSKASLESTNGCAVSKAITNKSELQSGDLPAPATECVKPESKENTNNLKFDHNQKLDLLKKVEGKSSRQTEKLLCEADPEISVSKEKLRFVGNGKTELKIIMDEDLRKKLEELKHLISHKNPNMSYQELFSILAEMGLKKYDPRQKLKKDMRVNLTKSKSILSKQVQSERKHLSFQRKVSFVEANSQSVQTKTNSIVSAPANTNQSIQKVQVKKVKFQKDSLDNNQQSKIKNPAISKQFIFENKNSQTKTNHPAKCANTDILERFNKQNSRYISAGIRRRSSVGANRNC